jgi:DMSO/TMAO reductase YedYZ molybdopterin-dependent catalytic subunit
MGFPLGGRHEAHVHRRTFLRATAALAAAPAASPLLAPLRAEGRSAGEPALIVRVSKPENFESPFASLDSFLTPNHLFYVRTHFGVYTGIDLRTWRLKVEGHVERPLDLSYDDLKKFPSRTRVALLECSGNGRVFLTPRVEGVAWGLGAVSTAEWVGVPLAAVLDRAGLKSDAVEVICEGSDSGALGGNAEESRSPGTLQYARSLPLDKARRPEVLLAYKMNGSDLPAAHGYPVRLLVPGWYGMASVKWLRRLIVTDRPFRGYFQTMTYSYFERRHGVPTLVPTTELQVKAEVARPALGEVVRVGRTYRVHGAAWTGESEVKKVEVSTAGGKTWQAAKLLDRSVKHAWRLWEYEWRPGAAGRHLVMARATDARGRTQPMQRDPARRNGIISHVLPVEVEVR